MSEPAHAFAGQCHCGALSMTLAFTRPADEMQVRSCQCDFCRRQGSLTVSDPGGKAVIDISAGALIAYRFATRSATTLICGHCGCYVGICMSEGDKVWSVANARGLDIPEFRERVGLQMLYDEETPDERIARRKEKWTPTELRFKL